MSMFTKKIQQRSKSEVLLLMLPRTHLIPTPNVDHAGSSQVRDELLLLEHEPSDQAVLLPPVASAQTGSS